MIPYQDEMLKAFGGGLLIKQGQAKELISTLLNDNPYPNGSSFARTVCNDQGFCILWLSPSSWNILRHKYWWIEEEFQEVMHGHGSFVIISKENSDEQEGL